jgi:hypothetical protein
MQRNVLAWTLVFVCILAVGAAAQTPRLMRFSGVVHDAQGAVRSGPVTLTFGIYADAEGGAALWTEAQTLTLGGDGRYSVVLGGTQAEGLPLGLFASGEARWLGVQVDDQAAGPRVMLLSVPYALKAADAETIGGKPASAFVLAPTPAGADGATSANPQGTKSGTSGAGALSQAAGSAGYIGVFTDTTNLGNSVLFQSGSSIGLGTTAPAAPFHVAGTSAPAAYFDVYSNSLGALPTVYRAARGTPAAPTAVQTDDILGGLAVRGYMATGWSAGRGQVMFKAAEPWTDSANGTYLQFTTTPTGAAGFSERMRITPAGFVGIGTTAPDALLTVSGNAHITGNTVVDGNIAAKYQDVAEWVESGEALEPGTVVVVDPTSRNGVRLATAAYDVGVAGAVSAQPGLILGEAAATKSLVAQSGRVRVKVDATYGAVRAGDLLVTSPTPGYAMVSKPVKVKGAALHRPGTILGKALEPLPNGKGEILVLLTLQ